VFSESYMAHFEGLDSSLAQGWQTYGACAISGALNHFSCTSFLARTTWLFRRQVLKRFWKLKHNVHDFLGTPVYTTRSLRSLDAKIT